jgi:hypothetical protein
MSDEDDIARALRARRANPFLSSQQAAYYLGLSNRQLERMRGSGKGPPFRRHCHHVRYHIDDLIVWSESTRRTRIDG